MNNYKQLLKASQWRMDIIKIPDITAMLLFILDKIIIIIYFCKPLMLFEISTPEL